MPGSIHGSILAKCLVILLLLLSACKSTRVNSTYWEQNCTRGIPQAIVDKENQLVEKHSFKLREIDAIENITLAQGTQIELRNWGCESYALSLTLHFPEIRTDPNDVSAWYHRCSEIIKNLHREGSAVNLQQVSNVLKDAIQEKASLKYGTEHFFGGTDIPQKVSVTHVNPGKKGTTVLMEIVVGPL